MTHPPTPYALAIMYYFRDPHRDGLAIGVTKPPPNVINFT